MEGVTVSARATGSSITTSVFTDADGEYFFPPLSEGQYKVWAQAVGYEAARTDVSLAKTLARWDVSLRTKKDFELQLPADRWLAALPEDTTENRRMKEVFRLACNGCHTHSFTLATRFDRKGWDQILAVMSRIGAYGYGDPANAAKGKPSPIIEKYKEPLAAWLTVMRGPGPSPMKFAPRSRPRGDATLMVVREYDIPDPGLRVSAVQRRQRLVERSRRLHGSRPPSHDGGDARLRRALMGLGLLPQQRTDDREGRLEDRRRHEHSRSRALRRNNGLPGGHDIETADDGMIWWIHRHGPARQGRSENRQG